MDARVKAKWIRALKSGKYKRITGVLADYEKLDENQVGIGKPTGYCCLGVLNDLYIKEHSLKKVGVYDFANKKNPEISGGKVLEWAGMHHSVCHTLAEVNDDKSDENDDRETYTTVIAHIEKFL